MRGDEDGMSLKSSFVKRLEDKNPQEPADRESGVDDVSAKVSRLATSTSISAFVAAGCLIFAFVTHSQASTALADAQADMRTVVVAAKAIPQGTTISEEMLTAAEIPSGYVDKDTVYDIKDAVGKQAVVKTEKGGQLRQGTLTGSDGSSSLASKLSKGKKAVSIDVSTETDFAQSLLRQGDRVNLYSFANGVKKLICKDVEVLALDGYTNYADMGQGAATSYSTVTVEVDNSTAETIRATQSSKTTIWMILNASVDRKN